MVYAQKLTKIGNSVGIVLPNSLLKSLNLHNGQQVYIQQIQDKAVITTSETSGVSPIFLKIAEELGNKYSQVFKELATK